MFERDEFDIHSDIHISFTQAVLGGEVKTESLGGPLLVKVCGTIWTVLDMFGQSPPPPPPPTTDSSWHCIASQDKARQQGNPQTQ